MKPRALSATTITGTNVQNLEGESIGNIQDLMIDLESGQILYAVLSFGGFMGLGDDYFAIPMEALTPSAQNQEVLKLNIDKSKLESASGFNKNDWPVEPSPEYVRSIYDHYGYEPRTYSPGI